MIVKVKKLNGIKVITLDAQNLGVIDGAQVDTTNWMITDLEVKLDKEAIQEMGLKKPKIGSLVVCLPINYIQTFGDVITLKHKQETLKNLKDCTHE